MKHILLILGLFLLSYGGGLAQGHVSWEQIPNVQLQDSMQFVSDEAHIISPTALESINATLQHLRQTQGVEGVVVTLPSIGEDGSIEELAREILRGWGVGSKIDNSGFIILISVKSRQIRIETGYGLEGVLPDALCSQIITHRMAPHFRQGDYGTGILAGVQAIQETVSANYEGATRTDGYEEQSDTTLILDGLLILLTLIIGVKMYTTYRHRESAPEYRVRRLTHQVLVFAGLTITFSLACTLLIAASTMVVTLALYFIYRYRLFKEAHCCTTCHQNRLHRLSPTAMLSLLTPAQQLEERLGSMRYMVKQCSNCGSTQKYFEEVNGSPYKCCPHCGTHAMQLVATRRLRSSDPRIAYIKCIEYHCLYCGQNHHDDEKVYKHDDLDNAGAAILGTIIGSSLGRGFGRGFGRGSFGGGSGGGGGATGSW